ncbi:hypothetical protein BV25DRAFT_1816642 [Artomyces pyxidatus]|uniref:Uncharacterized protein n=1 Tax=Artomyces pyxidatus TaxID=48021 RepID=A0ACB8SE58_9AGAM|nr:hypothetical protein BV25DRAFT_1816642 [Artomyces pyxidatus]
MANVRRRRPATDLLADDITDVEENAAFQTLLRHEVGWRDKQPFLESKGYMLRPRLRPGWVASWRSNGKRAVFCEDSHILPVRVLDATRMSDGMLVYFKRVDTGDLESTIALFLWAENLRDNPRNHSVPVLDIFPDPDNEHHSYMVMPFCNFMDKPAFTNVGEVVDFADQVLEGLLFMHEQGVAHRDCSRKNLMMDAGAMYPHGVHPLLPSFLPDGTTVNRHIIPRLKAGVKYHFVDYGISSFIAHGQPNLVVGLDGRDREVPELSDTDPFDPFKVDIFTIGNVLRREFRDKISNVEFFAPLIESMVHIDPARRPTAQAALQHWQTIRRGVSALHRLWRLKPRKEDGIVAAVLDLMALFISGVELTKWMVDWK